MSKAKVSFKLNNLKQKIKKLTKELKSEKFGETITDDIKRKIRKDGTNFKTNRPHKGLASSTVERRKYLAKYNKTHSAYSPSKSNLTFTGRLINSIKARIQSKGTSIIMKIDVRGTHAPYKGKSGEIGGRISNKEIRSNLAKQGRDPLKFSKKAKDNLTRIFMAIIKERLF